jgi:hypothetical protein
MDNLIIEWIYDFDIFSRVDNFYSTIEAQTEGRVLPQHDTNWRFHVVLALDDN